MNMKRLIFIWALCLFSVGAFSNNQVRLSLTKDLCTPRSVYLTLPRVNPNEIDSLQNAIKFNHGDTIVELFCPPIMNQGSSQESCTGWAFGYGCASIHAYDKYQDWNWARRSPSFLYNQAHDGTTCGVANVDSILRMLSHQGVCSYYLMPYDATDCNTQPDSIQRADAILNKSLRLSLSDTTDVLEYKQVLRMGHPVGVLTKYATDLQTLCSTPSAHGLWTSISNTDTTKSHTMCIVGYDDHQHLFKAMNSWGTNSGDSGYVWISYNLVQNGVIKEAYVFDSRGNGFVPQIEGPYTMSDTTAWYYVKNYPQGQNISWSLHNISATIFEFVTASEQGRDSMRVAYRAITYNPPGPVFPPVALSRYKYADLTVTVGSGDDTYSTTKRIRRQTSSYPMSSPARIDNTSYTLELWHSIYGLLRTQPAQSAEDQIDTSGLSQGLYIIILKENGQPIKQTKLLIP